MIQLRRSLIIAAILACAYCSARAQAPATPLIWLRADSGVATAHDTVQQWRDMSGHGYNADAIVPETRPIFIPRDTLGHAAVRFNGAGQCLRFPDIFPQHKSYTKIIVLRVNNKHQVNNILSGTEGHGIYCGTDNYTKVFQNHETFKYSFIPLAEDYSLMYVQFDQATLTGTIYLNGEYGGSGVSAFDNSDSTLYLGAVSRAYTFSGDILEVLIYDRTLNDSERAIVQEYLAGKYGIELFTSIKPFPFTSFPRKLQFYTRDSEDSAAVPISGVATDPQWKSARVDVYKDEKLWKSVSQSLGAGDIPGSFSLAPNIHAEMAEYRVKVFLTSDLGDSLIGDRDSIICGDAILISGQSNSISGSELATWVNPYCRSFGTTNVLDPYDPADTVFGWSVASDSYAGHLHVGEIGLKLQQSILERFGIPTCAICGGVGGTNIESQERNDTNHEDLTTIYGRLLYRMDKAGLSQNVRYMYWYQGESNGIDNYYSNFKRLYAAWREDYPKLERCYVVQIHPGCAMTDLTHAQLRDLERTLGDSIAGVTPLSVTSVPGHDECHFSYPGYMEIGTQFFRVLAHEFYGAPEYRDIYPPNIRSAYFSTPAHDEITITTRRQDTLVWPAPFLWDSVLYKMEDQFFLDSLPGSVKSGRIDGNTIILTLTAPTTATLLTYIPNRFYWGTETVYEGPWITNKSGVGMFTFNDIPIRNEPDTTEALAPLAAPVIDNQLRLSVAPNPVSSEAVFTLTAMKSESATVRLFTGSGELKWQKDVSLAAGANQVPVSTSALPSGVYYCVAHTSAGEARVVCIVGH